MSSISRFFTTTFTVQRQTWSNDSSALVSQDSFDGHIQQGTPENYQENIGFRFSKAFTIWCPSDTDIQEADRLSDGTNYYDVRFVVNRNVGANVHLQLIVENLDE